MGGFWRYGEYLSRRSDFVKSLLLDPRYSKGDIVPLIEDDSGFKVSYGGFFKALGRHSMMTPDLRAACSIKNRAMQSSEASECRIKENAKRDALVLARIKSAPHRSVGYVLGVVASDGCVSIQETSRRTISMIDVKVVNKSFADYYAIEAEKLFGKYVHVYRRKNTSCMPGSLKNNPMVWIVSVCSRAAARFVNSALDPSFILASDREVKIGFLQGLYDGDGYVKRSTKTGEVFGVGVSSGDLWTLELAKSLLEELGISSIVEKRIQNCWTLMTTKNGHVERFSELVGFRVDYRAERLRKGLERRVAC